MEWLIDNSFFALLLLVCIGIHFFGHGHGHGKHKPEVAKDRTREQVNGRKEK